MGGWIRKGPDGSCFCEVCSQNWGEDHYIGCRFNWGRVGKLNNLEKTTQYKQSSCPTCVIM